MKQNLLLMEDVADLGRSGDIVAVKQGYARNYLIPTGKGIVADKHTIQRPTLFKPRPKEKGRPLITGRPLGWIRYIIF